MFGDSMQSAGGVDGELDTIMLNNVDDMGRKDGRLHGPKFYSSWAHGLARQSKPGQTNLYRWTYRR